MNHLGIRLILIVIFFTLPLYAKSVQGLRNTVWGMSRIQVMSNETRPLIEKTDEFLQYTISLYGYDFKLFYRFTGNKLTEGTYVLAQNLEKNEDYLRLFNKYIYHLENVYGKTMKAKISWKNDYYRNDPERLPEALESGDVVLTGMMRIKGSIIILTVQRHEGKISFRIRYSP